MNRKELKQLNEIVIEIFDSMPVDELIEECDDFKIAIRKLYRFLDIANGRIKGIL